MDEPTYEKLQQDDIDGLNELNPVQSQEAQYMQLP